MKKRITLIMMVITMTLLSFSGCVNSDVIKIGHKNYTEQRLLGQMVSVYLESKGFKTKVTELGGTMLCYNALKNGNVDIYSEYTGTAYGAIYKEEASLGVNELFERVKILAKEDGLLWLDPLGYNNTYALCVRQSTATDNNLVTITDLINYSSTLKIAADPEFLSRQDGILGLLEKYPNLAFSDRVSMDQGLTYGALKDEQVDVISSFTTDGRIDAFNLINLVDDKEFFLPYYVTPTMKTEYAEANPEVVVALKELKDIWTDADMRGYNLAVDNGAKTIDIATKMLKDKGLIS